MKVGSRRSSRDFRARPVTDVTPPLYCAVTTTDALTLFKVEKKDDDTVSKQEPMPLIESGTSQDVLSVIKEEDDECHLLQQGFRGETFLVWEVLETMSRRACCLFAMCRAVAPLGRLERVAKNKEKRIKDSQ